MFLTTDDLTARGGVTKSVIKQIILEDIGGEQKQRMFEGERYYKGKHDILQKNFNESRITENYTDENGEEKEREIIFKNPNRSNHRNVNAFHRILVEQKVSYVLGREPSVWVRGSQESAKLAEYERITAAFCNDKFNVALQELITGASNKGFEALHFYYSKDGKLKFSIAPSTEIIPVYSDVNCDELEYVIRYYDERTRKGGGYATRKRIEVWDKLKVTTFYDDGEAQSEQPHWKENGKPKGWGRVPFIIMRNNRDATSDLQLIKGLIDAYDIISSGGTNNFIDLVDLYWVIEGYGAETASAAAKKLAINKAVHILDSNGSVEAKQVELPVEARSFHKIIINKKVLIKGYHSSDN